ncbi:helix-turn-helix domain-containing protein [Kribbella sp. CA-245084]|uniref:helix-turn-helix domain-containing protein n=1 Tax=Kribbella sp. CA-245084 TaxID=3239940 RepID=UPI003D8A70C6
MDDDPGREVFVSPVVVASQVFPARPGSLPDAEQFVREALEPIRLETEERQALYQAITAALLAAAGAKDNVFDVTVRIFPDGVEVEVLHGAGMHRVQPAAEPFADWLTGVLRGQGLSQEAAAQRIGVSVRTISRWLRGDTEPRMRDLRKVHEIFGP